MFDAARSRVAIRLDRDPHADREALRSAPRPPPAWEMPEVAEAVADTAAALRRDMSAELGAPQNPVCNPRGAG